ncbi:Peptidyl-prolyl cis-trans isomerase B (modular protein) [Candidatus Zixiibacteriota bacterium]|nr:Peptidyl-prolyl cis-trans isomerase B (modular protein) [candidate division Zixibacteria bacterium]
MKKVTTAAIIILMIIGAYFVFYQDIFNLRRDKADILASIIEYEDTRRAPAGLLDYLNDPDSEIRARAALAVGRIGDIGASEGLFKLINDSSDTVAQTAAFALGLTGEKSFAEGILEQCVDMPPERLAAAIQSIGRLPDSGMTDVITELTSYLALPDHRVRTQACYALWRAGAKSAANDLIGIAQNDPVRTVRIAALYSLVRLGIKEPSDLYAQFLPDSDPFVRVQAINGIGLAKDDGKTYLVAIGLNDKNGNVVAQAIISLASIGSPKAVEYLKNEYDNEVDEKLKVLLIDSFAKLKDSAIAEEVRRDIDSLDSPNIKASGIVYLAQIDGAEVLPLIDSLESLKNRYINVGIVHALGAIGGEYVKPRLNAFFKDSLPDVRAAAFEELLKNDAVNLDYYITTALNDTDYVVASTAADKIGELKAHQYLGRLLAFMKNGEKTDPDMKRSIVAAAAVFLDSTAVDSLAEEIIFHGLQDKEYVVSRDAAAVYKKKLGVDKSAYVNKPEGLASKRDIKNFITRYAVNPKALLSTDYGNIEIELYPDIAPLTVYNFIKLAKEQFYDGLTFHRVVPGFVVQGGDPRGDGSGGPGYYILCEYSDKPFDRGTVGIATSGKDTGGSQFFIMLGRAPHLDARYTLFGKVSKGMEAVDKIVKGDKIKAIQIIEEKKK